MDVEISARRRFRLSAGGDLLDERKRRKPNTERPQHLHRLPASHSLTLDSHDDGTRTHGVFVLHMLGYLHRVWLQMADWWLTGEYRWEIAATFHLPPRQRNCFCPTLTYVASLRDGKMFQSVKSSFAKGRRIATWNVFGPAPTSPKLDGKRNFLRRALVLMPVAHCAAHHSLNRATVPSSGHAMRRHPSDNQKVAQVSMDGKNSPARASE